MQSGFSRLAQQPRIAYASSGIAALALLAAYGADHAGIATLTCLAIGMTLMGMVVLAYHFPVYIRHNTKICVMSIPLYLMAILLPVPVAATVAGLSIAVGEYIVRAQRGTQGQDAVTNAARWVLVVLAGSALAHLQMHAGTLVVRELPLVLTAMMLWAGDLLTLPLVLSPITGERPGRIIVHVAREGGVVEAMQYGVGMIGALAATYQVWAVAMLAVPAMLVYLAFKKEIDEETIQLLESMADTVDLRDPYTGGHSRRVAEFAAGVLRELAMHGQESKLIKVAARVHDLGKGGLPDHLLIKPGALSEQEEAMVRSYPDRGAEMLTQYPDFSRGIEMVRHHHERWDGRGYPAGLKRSEIPFGARLIAVVDSFDAMTSERPYRRALPAERAAEILRDGRGRQWDPDIVDAFLRSIDLPIDRHDVPSRAREVPQAPSAVSRTVPA
jgi:HD-GYP domain-containing protein (c-di-GMP phosphodiesterase class II)